MSILSEKSEILFLYESTFSIPNGDPFTGEQRYDDETKRILVSDVRIKRFVRDFLKERGHEIFVINDKTVIGKDGEPGAASRLNALIEKYKSDPSLVPPSTVEVSDEGEDASKGKKTKSKKGSGINALALLQKCTDVRLFGGISTKEGLAVNITGPVQFALLNPSLNAVDLRMHQNTSLFSSSSEKSRGAIGTTSIVPYALCQIHGWINPYSAQLSGMTDSDVSDLFSALWKSINNANTRSKSNQNSILLLQIVYQNPDDKLYGIGKMVKLSSNKNDEQLRSDEDYQLDISLLLDKIMSEKIKTVRYYTESESIESILSNHAKFEKLQF